MSTPKTKKSPPLLECDSCGTSFLNKDVEKHTMDCPPNTQNITYCYISNGSLLGDLDVKKNEEVKGLSSSHVENLVFLSQSVIQLCDLSIGEWAVVEIKSVAPMVKQVWPTVEKSLTSVLLHKNVLDLYFGEVKSYPNVLVRKLKYPVKLARKISVVLLGNSKSIQINQHLLNRLSYTYKGRIVGFGNKISIFYFGKVLKFLVKLIDGNVGDLETQLEHLVITDAEFFEISEKTQWALYRNDDEYGKQIILQNPLSRIGGFSEEISELNEVIKDYIGFNTNLKKSNFTRSVLLYGNSGTGKTMLANALAKESKANIVIINGSDLYSKSSPEETMKTLFDDATQKSPSVIVLDEVDVLCHRKSSSGIDSKMRLASASLSVLLDKLHENLDAKVFIIATTNKIDNIDPDFRRCGRFEREIEIPTPSPKTRRDILQKLLAEFSHNLSENELQEISCSTHGFVGADLASVCRTAATHARRNTRIEFSDFKFALSVVSPSAMREVQIEVPNVKWCDIGGQEKLKLILKQAVEWPLEHAADFMRIGITPPKGVLMFGPPGCSKTMIAKALATESGLNFLSIKGPELFSKWVGESERAVRQVFRKARQVAPSIIFFDEIDALGGERSSGSSTNSVQERVLTQLLTELDGVTSRGNVTVLAATNRPDRIDKALLRPGRLDRIVYVPLPDRETRREIFKLNLQKMPVQNVDIETLVNLTENYSGAEVNAVCHDAGMKALEENIAAKVVTMDHFQQALEFITPRTPLSSIQLYEEYAFKNKSRNTEEPK